jgi:integrase
LSPTFITAMPNAALLKRLKAGSLGFSAASAPRRCNAMPVRSTRCATFSTARDCATSIEGSLLRSFARAALRASATPPSSAISGRYRASSTMRSTKVGSRTILLSPACAGSRRSALITLPQMEDIEHVISCAPGMIKDVIRAGMATGARQEELLNARRTDIDHERQQLTIVGKRDKRRTIALEPFGGYELVRTMPAAIGSSFLFWHSAGERYQNFSSQFAAIVRRAATRAKTRGVDFRPFRFHDLRHWHAVQWLKSGRSIYELQHRLGHSSVKVTEMYLRAGYLSFEEQAAVTTGARAHPRAQSISKSGEAS